MMKKREINNWWEDVHVKGWLINRTNYTITSISSNSPFLSFCFIFGATLFLTHHQSEYNFQQNAN